MTKTTVLNHSAMALKLRSIFNANKEMKAVSKMLTQEFTLAKTEDPTVMSLVMKNGETQAVNIIDNRFAVISYAKPKGGKNDTIFLNKTVAMTSLSANKVVVVDLLNRTVENGDLFAGFKLADGSNVAVNYLLGTALKLVAVRNYINHTQLYVVEMGEKTVVADNIKAVRAFINGEIKSLEDTFSEANVKSFEVDMETALAGVAA